MTQSLQDTYELARFALTRAAHEAAKEAARVESSLDFLRHILREHGLGVELRTGPRDGRVSNPTGEQWYRITLTTPSGGAVVVGQVKETSELTIGRLHETVGTPFFVRSVDTLAAQAARDAKREARTGAIGLAALGLLVAGVLYAVL